MKIIQSIISLCQCHSCGKMTRFGRDTCMACADALDEEIALLNQEWATYDLYKARARYMHLL